MTDDTKGSEQQEKQEKPKKRRKAIYVLVPHDIDDVAAERQEAVEPVEADEGEQQEKVEATKLDADFTLYIVPGGVGQKEAILGVLKKHNVDLKNISRVRMFKGEKSFRVETQYNIRF